MLYNGGTKRLSRIWLVIGLSVCCIVIARVFAGSEEEDGSQCNPQQHHSPSEALLQVAAQRVAAISAPKQSKKARTLQEKAEPFSSLSEEGPAEKTETNFDDAGVKEEDIEAFLTDFGMEKHVKREQAWEKAESEAKKRKARRMKARLRLENDEDNEEDEEKQDKNSDSKDKSKKNKGAQRKRATSRQKTKHS